MSKEKRYVVTMDMYVYAENDYMARKNAHKLADGLKSKLDEAKFLYNSAIANLKYVNLNNDLEKIKYSYLSSKQKLKINQDKLKTILTTLNGNEKISPKKHPLYLKHKSKSLKI